jgi:Domain of unknown function (DU1801)
MGRRVASENKLKPTPGSVADFIAGVEHPVRRADAQTLCRMMEEVSGEPAVLWSHSIIGFGRYRYRYDSGREGVAGRIGFSPRKANLTIYIVAGFKERPDLVARLGKCKTSVSCLYVNKLADVDLVALRELFEWSLAEMRKRYPPE